MEVVSRDYRTAFAVWADPICGSHSAATHQTARPAAGRQGTGMERLLSVDEVAGVLGTSDRFPRRLISERRIRFVRVGRHVRIPVSALEEFVREGTVDPVVITWRNGRVA
jgi:excisionase family DNA binding protein